MQLYGLAYEHSSKQLTELVRVWGFLTYPFQLFKIQLVTKTFKTVSHAFPFFQWVSRFQQ